MRGVVGLAVFVGAWSVALLTDAAEHDWIALPLATGGSIAAGLIVRRWASVLVALLVVPLAALAPCDSTRFECDVNSVALALILWAPIAAGLVALGVGVAKGARAVTGRRSQRAR